ncbi:MAG TPA: SRPBCC family protein [Streptosporangiaceae bacterium]|nr:SRPBCC family protein [Streptosporangiaceae bacterium]
MTQLHVEAEGVSRAAPEVVWELLDDASSYCEWGPWNGSGYQSPADQAHHGAGTIRWMRYGRTTTVERVLESEPGRRMTYTVVKGIPVRNYRAEVTLTPEGEGTHIRWSASWDRTLPGRIVHRRLRAIYTRVVSLLIAAADRKVPAGSQRD